MTRLASLSLTVTLSLVNGAVLAAETNTRSNSGQTNSSVSTGRVAPDAHEDVAPNNVDSSNMNSGGAALHPNGSSMNHEGMIRGEMRKNTVCKDGRCPDVSKGVEIGDSIDSDAETKTDGITQ